MIPTKIKQLTRLLYEKYDRFSKSNAIVFVHWIKVNDERQKVICTKKAQYSEVLCFFAWNDLQEIIKIDFIQRRDLIDLRFQSNKVEVVVYCRFHDIPDLLVIMRRDSVLPRKFLEIPVDIVNLDIIVAHLIELSCFQFEPRLQLIILFL